MEMALFHKNTLQAMSKLTLEDVDMKDVYDDLHLAIYMLHYLDKNSFSRKEVREVAFSLRVAANTIEKIMKEPKAEDNALT